MYAFGAGKRMKRLGKRIRGFPLHHATDSRPPHMYHALFGAGHGTLSHQVVSRPVAS